MELNTFKTLASLCIVGALVGCASGAKDTSGIKDSDSQTIAEPSRLMSDFSRSKLIVADFVSTMSQIPAIHPASTVMHTTRPDRQFGRLLLGALQDAGYDLRIGSETSNHWLAYTADREESISEAGNPVFTFIVASGDVQLKRSYEVDEFGVWPVGNMFVRGADASNVVADNTIFNNRRAQSGLGLSQPNQEANQVPVPQSSDLTASRELAPNQVASADANVTLQPVPSKDPIVLKTRETTQASANLNKPVWDEKAAAIDAMEIPSTRAGFSELSNLFETDTSRYAALFANYGVIDSDVLVFQNDSLVLGRVNKEAILDRATRVNPETDLISVIGCSHGNSALENGNAYLANSRAFRVKEEFIIAGLDAELVKEEGCWDGEHFPRMPARGVLIEHRRAVN